MRAQIKNVPAKIANADVIVANDENVHVKEIVNATALVTKKNKKS